LDHAIKVAARHASEYPVGRRFGGYSGNLIFIPAIPDANAHVIGPRAPPGLGLRDTSIVARFVAVRAFCQTHPKSKSLRIRERCFLGRRERHTCRRRHPKHRQNQRYLVKVSHRGSSSQVGKLLQEG
jgi:hypothetical protein